MRPKFARHIKKHRLMQADKNHVTDLSAGICPSRLVQTMTGSGSPVARHCRRTTECSETVASRGPATITGLSTNTQANANYTTHLSDGKARLETADTTEQVK